MQATLFLGTGGISCIRHKPPVVRRTAHAGCVHRLGLPFCLLAFVRLETFSRKNSSALSCAGSLGWISSVEFLEFGTCPFGRACFACIRQRTTVLAHPVSKWNRHVCARTDPGNCWSHE